MNAIELYEKLFYLFVGMAVLSLALSVFLFIRFDIPQTYAMLTGRARRKTIQEIENRNAKTGTLRQYPKAYTGETAHTGGRRRTEARTSHTEKTAKPEQREKTGNSGRTAKTLPHREARQPKQAPQPMPVERPETEVLSMAASETVMLSKPTGITEDLGQTEVLHQPQETHFYFQITENTVSIHTDEFI